MTTERNPYLRFATMREKEFLLHLGDQAEVFAPILTLEERRFIRALNRDALRALEGFSKYQLTTDFRIMRAVKIGKKISKKRREWTKIPKETL